MGLLQSVAFSFYNTRWHTHTHIHVHIYIYIYKQKQKGSYFSFKIL